MNDEQQRADDGRRTEIIAEPPDGRGFTWRTCKCGQLHMAPQGERNTLCPWCESIKRGPSKKEDADA